MDENKKLTKKEKRELAREKKQEARNKKQIAKNLKKLFVWLIAACLVVFVSFKGYKWVTSPTPQVSGISTIAISDSDWLRGNKEALVTLIEFGDFECPACVNYYSLVKKLEEEFPQDLRVVYRHFPLSQHKNALPAAKASEAAGMQGKFWEMYDVLYENHDDWVNEKDSKSKFEGYAKDLSLDIDKFKSDFESDEVSDLIVEDITFGRGLALNQTPTFYLNGEIIQPKSYEQFKNLVDEQIRGYTLEE